MRLNNKSVQRLALVVCAAVMAGGLGRYGLLWSDSRQWASMRQQADQLQQEIQRQAGQMADLAVALKDKSLAAAEFDRRVPDGKSFAELWRSLAELMALCGLTDQRVEPAEPVEVKGIGAARLKLQARGATKQVYAFIRAVEQMERLIRFESVQLSADPLFSGIVRLEAEATVFYQTAQPDAAKTPK